MCIRDRAIARQIAASKAIDTCGAVDTNMRDAEKKKTYDCIKRKTDSYYAEVLKNKDYTTDKLYSGGLKNQNQIIPIQDPAYNYCVNSGFKPSTEAFAICLSGANQTIVANEAAKRAAYLESVSQSAEINREFLRSTRNWRGLDVKLDIKSCSSLSIKPIASIGCSNVCINGQWAEIC